MSNATVKPPGAVKPAHVTVIVDSYFASHMKNPRGTGSWFFCAQPRLDFAHMQQGTDYVSFSCRSYADAKRAAKEWAVAQGHAWVWVQP